MHKALSISKETNIVLIGMPGVGKSTSGVLLAKAASRSFLDTDIYIQHIERRRLQDILDAEGTAAFRALEERHILSIVVRGHVVATGGSAVYSSAAMEHLRSNGISIHLDLPYPLLAERVGSLDARGVVMAPGQTLEALYEERQALYRRYADQTVDCTGLNHEQVVEKILKNLSA